MQGNKSKNEVYFTAMVRVSRTINFCAVVCVSLTTRWFVGHEPWQMRDIKNCNFPNENEIKRSIKEKSHISAGLLFTSKKFLNLFLFLSSFFLSSFFLWSCFFLSCFFLCCHFV